MDIIVIVLSKPILRLKTTIGWSSIMITFLINDAFHSKMF